MSAREGLYEDFGARSRYLRQGYVIASHRILWDAITYPCLRYLLLAPKSSYSMNNEMLAQFNGLLPLKIHAHQNQIIIPPETKFRGGILDSPCSSVRPSVRPSVRLSVRPWVGVRMITLILFSGFKKFFLHVSLGSRSCMGLNISVLPH